MIKIARHPWLLSLAVVLSTFAFVGGIIFAAYQVGQNRDRDRQRIAENARRISANSRLLEHEINQVRYSAYIFCRSEGRTPRACRQIARLVILPRELDVATLRTALAKIGEAQIGKLFVGTRGKRGRVGIHGIHGNKGIPGIPGVEGQRGKRGARGATGLNGAAGATGARGHRGLRGRRGVPGPVGPAGPVGPQGPQGPTGQVCPIGYTRGEFVFNTPKGHATILTCIKN